MSNNCWAGRRTLAPTEFDYFLGALKRRRRKGESWLKFCKRIGVDYSTLHRWRKSESPKACRTTAIRVCRELGIPTGPGTKILDSDPSLEDTPEVLRERLIYGGGAGPITALEVVQRAASFVQMRCFRNRVNVSLRCMAGDDPRSFLERPRGCGHRIAEIFVAEGNLSYVLYHTGDGSPEFSGIGDFTGLGASFCAEYLCDSEIPSQAGHLAKAFSPERQLKRHFSG